MYLKLLLRLTFIESVLLNFSHGATQRPRPLLTEWWWAVAAEQRARVSAACHQRRLTLRLTATAQQAPSADRYTNVIAKRITRMFGSLRPSVAETTPSDRDWSQIDDWQQPGYGDRRVSWSGGNYRSLPATGHATSYSCHSHLDVDVTRWRRTSVSVTNSVGRKTRWTRWLSKVLSWNHHWVH